MEGRTCQLIIIFQHNGLLLYVLVAVVVAVLLYPRATQVVLFNDFSSAADKQFRGKLVTRETFLSSLCERLLGFCTRIQGHARDDDDRRLYYRFPAAAWRIIYLVQLFWKIGIHYASRRAHFRPHHSTPSTPPPPPQKNKIK